MILDVSDNDAEEFATIQEELETSSSEALLPSSPQATIPNATVNIPNKRKCFILPPPFMLGRIFFHIDHVFGLGRNKRNENVA